MVTYRSPRLQAADPATLLGTALAYWDAGLTPIPHVAGVEEPSYVDPYGQVVPLAWGRYKDHQPPRERVARWFAQGDLATLRLELLVGSCAPTKYELPARPQILDCESAEVFEALVEDLHFSGHSNILYRCVIERTPSGGAHVGFRCQTISDKPKLVLARRADEDGRPTILIELLQHHLCTVAPTQVQWKSDRPTGATYRLTQGSWTQLQTISGEQRQILLDTCKSLNEVPEAVIEGHPSSTDRGTRPGDHLNTLADRDWWHALLTRHDWRDVTRPHHARQGMAAFQRPGKIGQGLSATYGKTGAYLYVFSSNADPFEPDRGYSPFAAYALLEHGGDFAQAAKALYQSWEATGSGPPPSTALADISTRLALLTPCDSMTLAGLAGLAGSGTSTATNTPPRERNSHEVRMAATIARYKRRLYADPYFGAPEHRAQGIPIATLIVKESRHANE
jgi:hypothetical protein